MYKGLEWFVQFLGLSYVGMCMSLFELKLDHIYLIKQIVHIKVAN